MTVNRALRELTSEGHLRRIQGVGTFVAPPKAQSTLIEISNISTEIKARGSRHRSEVVVLERIWRPQPELLLAFEFETVKPVDHSVVIHFENDLPVQLEERHVNPDLVPGYVEQDFTIAATYDYLQTATPLTEVEHLISAVPAGEHNARLLQVGARDCCGADGSPRHDRRRGQPAASRQPGGRAFRCAPRADGGPVQTSVPPVAAGGVSVVPSGKTA